jgi:predicted RNA-binding Zn-ribbon protein involved in translation (DUF1610 family)
MADTAFDQAAREWLSSHFGGDGICPACGQRQWRTSNPDYPIIQFTCLHCGRIVRTDLASIKDTAGVTDPP